MYSKGGAQSMLAMHRQLMGQVHRQHAAAAHPVAPPVQLQLTGAHKSADHGLLLGSSGVDTPAAICTFCDEGLIPSTVQPSAGTLSPVEAVQPFSFQTSTFEPQYILPTGC
jgi:hypothetical protein